MSVLVANGKTNFLAQRIKQIGQEPIHVKGLIYGLPYVGKTYLIGTAPDVLLILAEGDVAKTTLAQVSRDLGKRIDYVEVSSTDELRAVYMELRHGLMDGTLPYKVIAIDGLTELQIIFAQEILGEAAEDPKRASRNTEKLELGEWDWLANRTRNVLRAFRDLPCHVLVTARADLVKDEQMWMPYVKPARFRAELPGMFNLVGYLYRDDPDPNTARRVLSVGGGLDHIGKNPGSVLPSKIVNPDMAEIIKTVEEFNSKLGGVE